MKQTYVKFEFLKNANDALDLTEVDGYRRTCKRFLTLGNSNTSVFCTLNGFDVELAGGLELNSMIVEDLKLTSGPGILCQVVYDPIYAFQ